MSRPARHLLLIDYQVGFLRPGMDALRFNIERALREFAWDHITAARFINTEKSPWAKILGWHRLQTADEQAIAVKLPPHARVMDKFTYALAPAIVDHLVSAGPQDLFVAGLETDVCVTICAAQLFDLGLAPFVLADATGTTKGEEQHVLSLRGLGRIVGRHRIVHLDHITRTDPIPPP